MRKTDMALAAKGEYGAGKLVVFIPRSFDDCAGAADHLFSCHCVVVSLEKLETAQKRRFLDFMGGFSYAAGYEMRKGSDDVYLFTTKEHLLPESHGIQLDEGIGGLLI